MSPPYYGTPIPAKRSKQNASSDALEATIHSRMNLMPTYGILVKSIVT
jgi:hypothetical protein